MISWHKILFYIISDIFTLRPSLAFSYIGTLVALLHGTRAVRVSQTAAFRTYIRQGGHHAGYRPTF